MSEASEFAIRKNGTYLRHHQRVEMTEEKDRLTQQLTDPHVEDKPSVGRELRRVEALLENESPPVLTSSQRDVVARREEELREDISDNMLSQEAIRKCPPGTVGKLIAFEKRYKSDILEWKNSKLLLERDNDDPDIANLERYRPATRAIDPSMQGAQIPGKQFSFPSEGFKDGFDVMQAVKAGEIPENLSVQDARMLLTGLREMRAELDALKAEGVKQSKPKKSRGGRTWTDEEKAEASRKTKARYAEKKAQEAATQPTA